MVVLGYFVARGLVLARHHSRSGEAGGKLQNYFSL
jgi:hypothetical protein